MMRSVDGYEETLFMANVAYRLYEIRGERLAEVVMGGDEMGLDALKVLFDAAGEGVVTEKEKAVLEKLRGEKVTMVTGGGGEGEETTEVEIIAMAKILAMGEVVVSSGFLIQHVYNWLKGYVYDCENVLKAVEAGQDPTEVFRNKEVERILDGAYKSINADIMRGMSIKLKPLTNDEEWYIWAARAFKVYTAIRARTVTVDKNDPIGTIRSTREMILDISRFIPSDILLGDIISRIDSVLSINQTLLGTLLPLFRPVITLSIAILTYVMCTAHKKIRGGSGKCSRRRRYRRTYRSS